MEQLVMRKRGWLGSCVIAALATLIYGCGGTDSSNGSADTNSSANNAQSTQSLTVLHSFGGPDGSNPMGLLRSGSGDLYGVTTEGGASGMGTVYQLAQDGALTTLHDFTGSDGVEPYGNLAMDESGDLYGVTFNGEQSYGEVFEISAAGQFTILHAFSGPDGAFPEALVLGSDGNLYGVTADGGPDYSSNSDTSVMGNGTVFKLTPQGALTTLYAFNGIDGYGPSAILQAADGTLYGLTAGGGPTFQNSTVHGPGTVFRLTSDGVLTTLYALDGVTADQPSSIVQAADGTLYVSAAFGGEAGDGAVLQVSPAGAVSVLYQFDGSDGLYPNSLTLGSDGNLYGTAGGGGPAYQAGNMSSSSPGLVFELTPQGVLSTVYAFSGTDGIGPSALLRLSNGTFYGVTTQGGAVSQMGATGTVFELPSSAD